MNLRSCSTLLALLVSFPAWAKVSCEADLAVVARVVAENHLELPVLHDTLFVVSFPDAAVRSRKVAQVFENVVNQHCLTATAFMDTPYRRACAGDVVNSRGEFKDKRKLARLETVRFLLIDTVESFVFDMTATERDANLDQLRHLIARRVREGRPTMLVFEDPAHFERYLADLPSSPKTLVTSDKK